MHWSRRRQCVVVIWGHYGCKPGLQEFARLLIKSVSRSTVFHSCLRCRCHNGSSSYSSSRCHIRKLQRNWRRWWESRCTLGLYFKAIIIIVTIHLRYISSSICVTKCPPGSGSHVFCNCNDRICSLYWVLYYITRVRHLSVLSASPT